MTEMLDVKKICCFTGHRLYKLHADEETIKNRLNAAIDQAIANGFTTFITGMAQGTDIWAAEIVLSKRRRCPQLKLVCALPHPDFEKRWNKEWRDRYKAILDHADYEQTVCSFYAKTAYQQRNMWMVDHSSLLIAVFNGEPGGTLNTIEYARHKHVDILYVV